MSALEGALKVYRDQLLPAWKQGKLEDVGRLLTQLKIALTEGGMFIPATDGELPPEGALVLARDVLEVGAQWSLKMQDVSSFERYIAQLKPYYFDYCKNIRSEAQSAFMHELLGLNLLCLLSQNRIAEFHTELERLDPSLLRKNMYIRHPVALEQHLMEGSYNKVFQSRHSTPAASYVFFVDRLMDTVRLEIAACLEKSYEKLSVANAQKLLFLSSQSELDAMIEENGWTVFDEEIRFPEKTVAQAQVPAEKMMRRMLDYARELERIV
eukprot:m.241530 g.241530  ORF g.241530 m.241530 type:complete len:268 (+) comp18999_c0_seq12:1118-1921(+)